MPSRWRKCDNLHNSGAGEHIQEPGNGTKRSTPASLGGCRLEDPAGAETGVLRREEFKLGLGLLPGSRRLLGRLEIPDYLEHIGPPDRWQRLGT
jgi:hypothetical protein